MIACSRRLITLRVRNPQHYLLPKFFSSTMMSGSHDLQPQKRILVAEDSENLSKKPRLVEEAMFQAESSSLPPCLEANPRDDPNNTITGVPLVDMRMAVVIDGSGGEEEDQMQTENVNNRPSTSLEHEGNQSSSKGKKKKIRPPRVGRRSRNEEDEERRRKGTLLLPTTTGEMEPPTKALRLPKRQCALLLGFCGSGYRGMQM